MPAQLGFVVHAAQAQALKLPAQRTRDGLAERSFSDSRRSDEAQDRRFGARVQLQHAKVLQNALFDVFQAEMVLIQHLRAHVAMSSLSLAALFHGSSSTNSSQVRLTL